MVNKNFRTDSARDSECTSGSVKGTDTVRRRERESNVACVGMGMDSLGYSGHPGYAGR